MTEAAFPLTFHDGYTMTDAAQAEALVHEQLHIAWCHEGTGTVSVAGRIFDFGPRSILLLAPGQTYNARSTRGNISIWSVISLDLIGILGAVVPDQHLLRVDDLRGPHFQYIVNEKDQRALCKLVSQMVAELRLQQGNWREAMLAFCRTLALHLRRLPGRLTVDAQEWCAQLARLQPALTRIAEQMAEDPRVEDLALLCDLGFSQFNQQFTQFIGCTVRDYMLRSRLHYAAGLLSHALFSVEDIASFVGFEDPLSFQQVFERHYGQSAQSWRRK